MIRLDCIVKTSAAIIGAIAPRTTLNDLEYRPSWTTDR